MEAKDDYLVEMEKFSCGYRKQREFNLITTLETKPWCSQGHLDSISCLVADRHTIPSSCGVPRVSDHARPAVAHRESWRCSGCPAAGAAQSTSSDQLSPLSRAGDWAQSSLLPPQNFPPRWHWAEHVTALLGVAGN